MKNIFKLMGLALIAGSMMFVACNKDDEGNGGNGNNPTPEPDGYYITMDGDSWQPVEILGRYNEAGVDDDGNAYDAYMTMQVNKTEAEDSPYILGYLQATTISNGTYESTGGDIMNYRDVNDIYTDNDGVLGTAGGQYYNFVADRTSFVENITAIDLNATTMSGDWTENYLDLPTYIANNGAFTGAKTLSGVMRNITWTAAK